MNIRRFAVATVLLLATGVTHAANFNMTGFRTQSGSSFIDLLADDGLLRATATALMGTVGANTNGMGVIFGDTRRALGDAETLRIDFAQTVNLGELRLRRFDRWDNLEVNWSGGSMLIDDGTSARNEFRTLNLTAIDWVSFTSEGNRSQFLVAGMNDVTAVPLPAAAWLFGSALAMLFAGGRRCQRGN